MKIIVTGSDGFVGRHLVELLKKDSRNRVFPFDRHQADITKFAAVKNYLAKIKPDQVYHLAGFASGAGKDKKLIFKVNVDGTLNILKALKEIGKPVKIMLASTAYVYGNTLQCATEKSKIEAKSFYDQSKIEMEREALKYQSDNIQLVISRATNHTGPGQKPGFVVPDFCQKIVNAKDGDIIEVGNLEAERDIFDVSDCIQAYVIAMEKRESGEIYNIGLGQPVKMKEILEKLIKLSGKNLSHRIDPNKMRPSDISKNCVNASKIKNLGWKPCISLDKTLEDVLEYWIRQTGGQ